MTSTKDPEVATDEAVSVSITDVAEVADRKLPDQLVRAGRAGWKLTADPFVRVGTLVALIKNPLIVAGYLILGMLVYAHTQLKPCGDQDIEELEAVGCFGEASECTECVMSWTYTDAIYFAMATISTCARRVGLCR